MNSEEALKKTSSKNKLRKMLVTAMFSCMSFVLSTVVVFPNMAPFQHFANVITGVFVGPWYALAAAFFTGGMRMTLEGTPILSITGAIFGAFLAGAGYRVTGKLWVAYMGELIGTGIISAIVSYPIMKYLFGLTALRHFYYYIPFFVPASAVGGFMGLIVLFSLRRSGLLQKWLTKLNG